MLRLGTLSSAFRRYGRYFQAPSFVLLYHRVADLATDPWKLCVSPRHFAEQLEVLEENAGPVVPLGEFAVGRPARHSVAITFDDGYVDNLLAAAPALERKGMPATFFIATGYIDSFREFWWDELEKAILSSATLPSVLSLEIEGRAFKRPVPASEDRSARRNFYYELYDVLIELPSPTLTTVMDCIVKWASVSPSVRETHRTLSVEQLGKLASSPLMQFGAHSVSHSALPALPPSLRRQEMWDSRRTLERWLNRSITETSYPYGRYCADTMVAAREAGFTAAFTTEPGPHCADASRYALPRVCIGDWNGDEFVKRLRDRFRGGSTL